MSSTKIPLKSDFGDLSEDKLQLLEKLMIVHRSQSTIGNVLTYHDVDFFLDQIPNEFQLQLTLIDDETAQILLEAIRDVTKNSADPSTLQEICMALLLLSNPTAKFASFSIGYKPAGEALEPTKCGKSVMITLAGGDLFIFKNSKNGEVREIYLPKNTVLLSNDPKGRWMRSVASGEVKAHGFKQYKSEEMYTLVINWT